MRILFLVRLCGSLEINLECLLLLSLITWNIFKEPLIVLFFLIDPVRLIVCVAAGALGLCVRLGKSGACLLILIIFKYEANDRRDVLIFTLLPVPGQRFLVAFFGPNRWEIVAETVDLGLLADLVEIDFKLFD